MKRPQPKSAVLRTSPYVPGARAIEGSNRVIKLSSNESPLGPSPQAIHAYHAAGSELFRYPDASQQALREALGQIYDIEPDRIVCGNGSDEVLSLLIRAYTGPGDHVVLSQYCFAMCMTHALVQGADVSIAPEPDYRISVDEVLGQVNPHTRLVVIASPNNPCGTYLPAAELARLHAGLRPDTLLIVDAAYAEYVTALDYDSGLKLARGADNVVVTHTFSKLYGLAGLRIGWGYGPRDTIDTLNRIRTPFNANSAALAAATAAVRDREHAERVRTHVAHWRERLADECCRLGLSVIPSSTNFVLILFPGGERDAGSAAEHLRARGIIPRPVGAGGPDNALRITIGLQTDNEAVIEALRDFVSPARQ